MAKVKSWHDDAVKARKEWDAENGYYTAFESCVCVDCVHFSINHDHPSMGDCNKMKRAFQEQEFGKRGVMCDGVSTHGFCENFMNSHGIGVDGKVIMPQLLPPFYRTRKDKKTGEIFLR